MSNLLIYGANGYTGRLICQVAKEKGLQPILAGRNETVISVLAEQYGWPYRIFELHSAKEVATFLSGVAVVLHCAGPFRFTAAPMMDACIATGVHYLDITGEIAVFEQAWQRHNQAVKAGVMLLPGTGFDVVPTDWLAWHLHQLMPDATALELAFVTIGGQISHGTATSMLQRIEEGGMIRRNGQLQKQPTGKLTKTIMANGKQFTTMSIPWGDVFTAFHTTGIPNITVYTGARPKLIRLVRLLPLLKSILKTKWVKSKLQHIIDKRPPGPDAQRRQRAVNHIWGAVQNNQGERIEAGFTCREGYTLTAITAVGIAKWVLSGQSKPGYQTPVGAFGDELKELIEPLSPLMHRKI